MMQRRTSMPYNKKSMLFSIFYVNRKTLEIVVMPDSTVEVKAPLGTEYKEVEKRVARRSRWIRKQQEYFRQFDPRTPARKYVSGETHLYLGRQYRLKISEGSQEEIKLASGRFQVTTKTGSKQAGAKRLLGLWYREKAKVQFSERLNAVLGYMARNGIAKPNLQVKSMKKRWGSLSRKKTLTLNVDLVRAPKMCIDYVIAHELCHMMHHNHGRGFHLLLGKVMPDWETRKHKLELMMV